MSSYQLRAADLWSGESLGVNPPLVRAAANPDARVLKRLLSHGLREWKAVTGREPHASERNLLDPNSYAVDEDDGMWLTTPLLVAVDHGHLAHVRLLVTAGADPNGVAVDTLCRLAAQWLRRHDCENPSIGDLCEDVESEDLLSWFVSPAETGFVTKGERLFKGDQHYRDSQFQNRHKPLNPFWSTGLQCNQDSVKEGPPMTSLMRAAQLGNIELFDELVQLGADEAYWLDSSTWNGPITHAAASRSTPLHLAVQNNHPMMVQHLLDRGHDPNCFPMSSAVTAVTPLMASIMWYPTSPESYKILARHPRSDWGRRTTYCDVHSGHFAVATGHVNLLTDVLERTSFDLTDSTALGHTPLHIIFLPSGSVNLEGMTAVRDSLYDTRSLSLPFSELTSDPPGHVHRSRIMVDWLVERSEESLLMTDVYGNTPLHYRACLGGSFQSLPPRMKTSTVEKIWCEERNAFGHTPFNLAADYRP